MNVVELINKKKKKMELTKEEIDFLINSYMKEEVKEYQMSALLMAIVLNGMTEDEIVNLTESFVNSGDRIDFSKINKPIVDKHSTGGVGDKTSLVLIPLLAACDLVVAKMSGRGLGHTGGTIDKLESIEGFNIELSELEFMQQVEQIGLALIGQTDSLVPADKKIYALRDVTGTVDSIPLIAASIMSKKIASGSEYIVLDVKYGSGAFMKTKEDAILLGEELVKIGKGVNRKTCAVISSMQQPLGTAIGNALEVNEAIATLKGEGPKDLYDLSCILATALLMMTGKVTNESEAMSLIDEVIKNGLALQKLIDLVVAQGGKKESLLNLVVSNKVIDVIAENDGFVSELSAEKLGIASMLLGAGRQTKNDLIDTSVGLVLEKKVGCYVNKGDVLCKVYYSNTNKLENAINKIKDAYIITNVAPSEIELVEKIIK